MSLYFLSSEECQNRLNGTVIFLGDNPVYIDSVNGDLITYYSLPLAAGSKPKIVNRRDPDLRAHDLSLGYMNYDNPKEPRAVYFIRTPKRQWRQGLHAGVLETHPHEQFNWAHLLESDTFRDMLKNKYPSFNECVRKLQPLNVGRIAFAKRLALFKSRAGADQIEYRGQRCASSHDGRTFRLGQQYHWVKEQLNDLGIQTINGD